MNPQRELELRVPPLVEWCVRQDFGCGAGCIWVLARSESGVRRQAVPVLRNVFPASAPAGPVEVFPRAEYGERAGPHDFTAGVRLREPRPAR